ncbi:hypothetical protein GCM10029976_082680 [Kribbella albertanoniae]|uniref:Uncharacterized protein n=1 Tax=Kribbella albertanoniae TaxID=1266829 RepID=A0A4R4QEK9_9ACTN|nr:hypothetical protein [Kribbella albertanoniae]TDC33542.1 hypothetical protein E1261_05905 [Kribbella albertanoniae]
MSTKAERQAAREQVAAYHEAQLAALIQRVAEAVDRFRGGELDAFEADEVMFQYQRAARQLWTFCQGAGSRAEFTAQIIQRMAEDGEPIDWWERGRPHRRS